MTDIVERLRAEKTETFLWDKNQGLNKLIKPTELELEAADEIEKLRAALENIKKADDDKFANWSSLFRRPKETNND